jgi:8-oxo-dGTP diphosphatase
MNIEELEDLVRQMYASTMPGLSIDCVVFGFHDNAIKILSLRFNNSGAWMLPNGLIFHEESIQQAAQRILSERTSLKDIFLKQFYTFGDLDRTNIEDMKTMMPFPSILEMVPKRAISIGYYALVEHSKVQPQLDFMTAECRWFGVDELPKMIFDHNKIVEIGLKSLRAQIDHLPTGYHLMPETFTMPELQKLHEAILGEPLDRANFQKRILSYDILERLEERRTGGAHKSPFVYRFIPEKYEAFLQREF